MIKELLRKWKQATCYHEWFAWRIHDEKGGIDARFCRLCSKSEYQERHFK